ncbi:MAG: Urea carboxylase [Frankiales bacterium]|nr:Urea carboxylase [Frankiales bacterium]
MTTVAVRTVTVVEPGLQTTVQELPGRTGYWDVGVPPSGAWDDLSFALANLAVGNPVGAAGLECVMTGPTLRFGSRALICLAGAIGSALLDGRPVRTGIVLAVPAGTVLTVGPLTGPGMRGYVAVAGGIDVPLVLGSRATFLLGELGGYDGRALAADDELPLGSDENALAPLDVAPLLPRLTTEWVLSVVPGPHGAPEHLTPGGVEDLFAARWTVDHRADRTGVRLTGPRPGWAREDGGEAGLHPSNIHDSAYPVGGIMLSGDTPVIVGPDGPSLGGFVVPCTVISADRWKLAQLRPGDSVRLEPVTPCQADDLMAVRRWLLADPRAAVAAVLDQELIGPAPSASVSGPAHRPDALAQVPASGHRPSVTVRRSGDCHLLLEAGPSVLDLHVRVWVHLLAEALRARSLDGVLELVEGVRSMLVKVDPQRLPLQDLAHLLADLAVDVPDPEHVEIPVREVTLPLCLDHPLAHEAMRRYATSVRPDAPWCPDNVEFIRRINDLASRDEVFEVVTSATYLVVGLGDVYLGAPVAVPLDPRHRLVTTKYDPARTWTPQNAVGIGGVYLCIYGMEGPGGYQLVGRTVPVWRLSDDSPPWLLRPFDRLRFVPVSEDELAQLRASGQPLVTAPAVFSLAEVRALEAAHADEIETLRSRRRAAFDEERERWGR